MFDIVTPISRKIVVVSFVSLSMGFTALLGCNTMTSDAPLLAQEPETVELSTSVQMSKSMPPNDKYLFMEIMIAFDGSGTLPIKFIDFPGYEYDSSTGVLKSSHGRGKKASLTSADWGFIGVGQTRSGAMGGGTASELITIDQLPFTISAPTFAGKLGEYAEEINYIPITLLTISTDGEVLVDIDGQQLVLPMGERWEQTEEIKVNNERFNGNLLAIFTVINYGWNARDLIDSK